VTRSGLRAALLIVLLFMAGGCGLLFQGMHQDVTLQTEPAGASASFAGQPVTTPGEVRVRRRPAWAIARASKEGYHPACRLMTARNNKLILVLDAIPYALPLALDAALGTLRAYPETVTLTLHPVEAGESPYVLPPDEDLLDAWFREKRDLCNTYAVKRRAWNDDAASLVE